jgi:peptidyl-tRNA hydrolase, PTH2 family
MSQLRCVRQSGNENILLSSDPHIWNQIQQETNKKATTAMMIMPSPNSDTVKAFVAGALLPTVAVIWLWKRQRELLELAREMEDGYDCSEEEEEDDDNNDDGVVRDTTTTSESSHRWGISHAPYKMILAVNTDLAMGKGKIAAQCGHAAVGCYRVAHRRIPHAVQAWNLTGCAKIAVKCPEREYTALLAACKAQGIPYYLVEDAGRTQIAAGSKTVLALLAPVAVLATVTDHLKLL